MRKLTYLAVFEPTKTGYSIYFPDLPGCISVGSNIEEAQKYAKEALGLHIYGMEKDDDDEIPAPSIMLDPAEVEGCLVCPITILPDLVKKEIDNRRVKINTTIPAWLKDLAQEHNVNYSQLLETALMEYLQISKNK